MAFMCERYSDKCMHVYTIFSFIQPVLSFVLQVTKPGEATDGQAPSTDNKGVFCAGFLFCSFFWVLSVVFLYVCEC